jgi:uncharacterized protein
MAASNLPRIRAVCKILVGGEDVTDRMAPHLLQLVISLYTGKGDQCQIELDDRDASLRVPGQNEPIEILLGWRNQGIVSVFSGFVRDVESAFFRKGGGRILSVEGWGHDQLGDIKTPFKFSMGEGEGGEKVSLEDFLKKAAGFAGVQNIRVHPDLAKIKRDYWHMNESFKNLGARLGEELGGVLSFSGNNAAFTPLMGGFDALGEPMSTVDAKWGDNLIGWRIKPYVSPPDYGKSSGEHFDIGGGIWNLVEKTIGGEGPFSHATATAKRPSPAANEDVAGQQNQGTSDAVNVNRGFGFVIIDGEPVARPGGMCMVTGARPGVDGLYGIQAVEHFYSRAGFTTRVQLWRPRSDGGSG